MKTEIIKQWQRNKHLLKNYFATNKQSYYDSYADIVVKLFELVINEEYELERYDIDKMTVIDDGDYQGTQIFIIPEQTYQPDAEQYLVTDTWYGSCSGCDTLQGISEYSDDLPTEKQVDEYMTLSLHLIQKMRSL